MRVVHRHCADKHRAGTAATEFALTIPLLMLLAIACMDFGRIAHHAELISSAARSGAETGAMQQFTDYTRPTWEAGVREAVVQEMQNLPDFNEAEFEYGLSVTTDSEGIICVVVDVAYPFNTIVMWPALPSEVKLRERIQFRQFR